MKLPSHDFESCASAIPPFWQICAINADIIAHNFLICKKIYAADLEPDKFIDKSNAEKWYNDDYHRLYFGEIIKVLEK